MPKDQRYISKDLAHFVGRGKVPDDQYSLLVHILQEGWLTHPPHKPNIIGNVFINFSEKLSANEMYSPQVVCFCDIPVEDLRIHTSKYSRFGLSLSKELVALQGGTPVFYLPLYANSSSDGQLIAKLSKGRVDELDEKVPLGELFDRMVPELNSLMRGLLSPPILKTNQAPRIPDEHRRLLYLYQFLNFHFLSYVKFFDNHLDDDDPANFYMEREWRVLGNVHFGLEDVKRIFIPRDFAKRLRIDLPDFSGEIIFID